MIAIPHIIESALMLLAAFLIGCGIGYGLRRVFRRRVTASSSPATSTTTPTSGRLDSPRGGKPDDLRKIKGLGLTMEKKLHAAGVYHIDQIAAWDMAAIARMDAELNAKGRIARDDWVGQARGLTTET